MERYSQKVLKLFLQPVNVGAMEDADVTAVAGSVACGDMIKLYLKFDETGKKIKKATFESFGCAANIATASMMTMLIENKDIEEAEKIGFKEVVESLGGLPRIKHHCAVLAIQALKVALEKWRIKRGEKPMDEKMIKNLLRNILDPHTEKDLISSKIYRTAEISGNKIKIHISAPEDEYLEEIKSNILEAFEGLDYEVEIINEG